MNQMPLQLPHDDAAERSVIGGLLYNGRAADTVMLLVESPDFYDGKHEAIYAAMKSLYHKSTPIDVVTTSAELTRLGLMGKLAAVNGDAFLINLYNETVVTENISHHAKIVRDKSLARQGILAADRAKQLLMRDELPIDEALARTQKDFYALTEKRQTSKPRRFKAVLRDALKDIEYRFHHRQAVIGVSSGIEELDEMTGGYQAAELIAIGARPGMGKTAFVLHTAEAAGERNIPTLIFSAEMRALQLGKRSLASNGRVDGQAIKTGFLTREDFTRLNRAMGRLVDMPIWIDEGSRPSLGDIEAKCRQWRSDPEVFPRTEDREPLGLIIVDYLQLVSAMGSFHSREREVASISAGLKALAKDLLLPVVAVVSLNRKCDDRTDKRPMQSDINESGKIEFDSDTIIFLYRDEFYNSQTKEPGVCELLVRKQRDGRTGVARAAFIANETRFANLSNRKDPWTPTTKS